MTTETDLKSAREQFEEYLRSQSLKLTPQRQRILDHALRAREHFSADTLYGWLQAEDGPDVSRATVYRTLNLLQEGGFVDALDTGRGELVYEHTAGQEHHDHMVCVECGGIEEFHNERIEELQLEACRKKGFKLISHTHRLMGLCRECQQRTQ